MERDVLNYKQILLSLLPKIVKIDLLQVNIKFIKINKVF